MNNAQDNKSTRFHLGWIATTADGRRYLVKGRVGADSPSLIRRNYGPAKGHPFYLAKLEGSTGCLYPLCPTAVLTMHKLG